MAGISNMDKVFMDGAIEAFTDMVAPLTAFSYAANSVGASLNDKVKVAFVSNASGSSTFAYSTGYTGASNGVLGVDVTLDTLLYQPIGLTDADLAKMSPEVVTRLGKQAGARLAADVVSASFASVITAANYPASSSVPYTSTSYTSSLALADLDKQANVLKWTDGERYLIAGTTLWSNLMNNTSVINAANYGSAEAIKNGTLPSVMGFIPYKTTVSLPNSDTGFAVNPNAILFANAYHQPGADAGSFVTSAQSTDEKTGLTIGLRSWYDPSKATTVRVLDCLFGVAKGNPNALIHIK